MGVSIMRTLVLAVVPIVILAVVDAQYSGGVCDWSVCRYDRYLAQRCCSSSGTCCDFANGGGNYNGGGYITTTSLATALPTMGGRRGRPEEDSPATTATTMEARATTLVTTMATTMAATTLVTIMVTTMAVTTLGMAMATATTLDTAMVTATTPATTTTEGAISETAIVPPISSAVISDLATSAPGQTIMADQHQSDNIKNSKTNDNVAHLFEMIWKHDWTQRPQRRILLLIRTKVDHCNLARF